MKKPFLYVLLLLLCYVPSVEGKKYYPYKVAACAIFRDDARFLKEWIDFHRLVGVKHFWLYNNLSTDDYLSVLSPYIAEGVVELIEWPYESADWDHWHQIQNSAYEHAISLAREQTIWLALIDTDEFLFPVKKWDLYSVLKDYEKYGAVCVNWQMYGTSGVRRVPENKLMIETLTRKAETYFTKNHYVKSIVRPEKVKRVPSAHFCHFFGNDHQVDEKKHRFIGQLSPKVLIDKLRINHYWTRDEEFFIEKKMSRRDKPGSNFEDFLKDYDYLNEVEDTSILRFFKQKQVAPCAYGTPE